MPGPAFHCPFTAFHRPFTAFHRLSPPFTAVLLQVPTDVLSPMVKKKTPTICYESRTFSSAPPVLADSSEICGSFHQSKNRDFGTGESRSAAAVPMEDPYCSCKRNRERPATACSCSPCGGSLLQL